MPIVATRGSGETFTPAPAGVHAAVCCDVVDLGMLKVQWQGKEKEQHKILISWQINEDRDDGKPYLVSKRYTLSLFDRAALRQDLENWRGRPFNDNEADGFDVEVLIGVPCMLNVQHRVSNGKTYANVTSIMPLAKGMERLSVRDYVRKIDRAQTQEPAHDDAPNAPITDDDIPF